MEMDEEECLDDLPSADQQEADGVQRLKSKPRCVVEAVCCISAVPVV